MNFNNVLFNKKVAIYTLGCKVNAYESEVIKESFKSYGAVVVDFKEVADVYVVNTCTVTAIADHKSRQILNRAKALNEEAIIVGCGCYVQEAKADLSNINLIVGNRLKGKIADFVNEYIVNGKTEQEKHFESELVDYEAVKVISNYDRSRVDIKIQDGCNQFCSYCLIPYARGRISSRNVNEIVTEVKGLAEKGFKEVVLTGIHISSFGMEKYTVSEQAALKCNDGRMPLIELIEQLNEIEGLERIRLGSLEPRIISEEFVEALSKCEKVMPHFHLSLQSGCDTVLKRMNRKYTTEEYEKCCEYLRQFYYKPSITTDIIVGFPGETEEEFEISKEFVKKIDFSAIHIFPFSKREGTAAAKMQETLTKNDKGRRAAELAEIEKINRKNYELSFDGDFKTILAEEFMENDGVCYLSGFTPEYVKVFVEGKKDELNQILEVRMTNQTLNDVVLALR